MFCNGEKKIYKLKKQMYINTWFSQVISILWTILKTIYWKFFVLKSKTLFTNKYHTISNIVLYNRLVNRNKFYRFEVYPSN